MKDKPDTKAKVLVVDDDAGLLRLIQNNLVSLGYGCDCIANGREAVERLVDSDYELLLLDYNLPGMTGTELIERLEEKECRLPFVIMTGCGDEKIAVEMMKLGARDYLVKDHYFLDLLPRVVKKNLKQLETAKKLAETEEVLASKEGLYQTLIESVPHVIWMGDADGQLVFLNKAWNHLTGRTPEESLGQRWVEALHPEGAAAILAEWLQAHERGEPYQGECRLQTKNGSHKTVEYVATPVRDKTKKIINWVGINTNISERKEAEEELKRLYLELRESQSQLIQSEKMSALGTLTAGVAHELNNPMMGILNFTQYCLKHTSQDDRRYSVLTDTEVEIARCAEIVENLLTFSRYQREGDENLTLEDLVEIVDRVLRLLTYRIETLNVRVIKDYSKNLRQVKVNVNNIQQVFLNIITNALDAVADCNEREIRIAIQNCDGYVSTRITDSGSGIGHAELDKIFEPFFTTKPTGAGTGLGLSVSRSIVESHGGKILCKSEPSAGTIFDISLPSWQEP